MTTLLHGENITASRSRLLEIRSNFNGEVIILNGQSTPPQEVAMALTSASLFQDKKLVVIESALDIKNLPSPDKGSPIDLILWEDGKLTAAQLNFLKKIFPDLKVEEFTVPPAVFRFLESLRPGEQKVFLPLWQTYIRTEVLEVAATMLTRQFRLLLLVKQKNPGFEDLKSLAPWQISRLEQQSAAFTQSKLTLFLKELLEIDYALKSGKRPDLQTSLELLLLSL